MTRPPRRLQNRLMLAFAGFVLATASLYGLYALAFMYAVEDTFFETMVAQEVQAQLQHRARSGQWATPRDASMRVYTDEAALPPEVRQPLRAAPWRHEFPGAQGRHYHLRTMTPPAPASPAWLVAEVSGQLVVRPIRGKVVALLAGTGAVIVLAGLLTGYWLARRTAGPLSRLAARVESLSPDRLPRDVARGFADDEVGTLARALEQLIGRVHDFIVREQEFTRDASHELRTPLAVILASTERLMTETQLSEGGRRHLGHIHQSVLQLDQTVTTLLALAREESCAPAAGDSAVVPVLERVIVEQSPLLRGGDVDVDLQVADETRIALPATVLHILLSNLVGNAFAHTSTGEVRIDVHHGRLRIANTGDGDDAHRRWREPRPFDKRAGSGGSGLGLAIVRRLCDRYGIDLRIDHEQDRTVASIAMATRHA